MFAGNFAPSGWMTCDGQTLPISEYETLFNLIGTTYGGDGEETFLLPNLAARRPMHMGTRAGTTYQIGETLGVETVMLTVNQIPVHTHTLLASALAPSSAAPSASVALATPLRSQAPLFSAAPAAVTVPLAAASVGSMGGGQPISILQPYGAVTFIISLFGIFPSQT